MKSCGEPSGVQRRNRLVIDCDVADVHPVANDHDDSGIPEDDYVRSKNINKCCEIRSSRFVGVHLYSFSLWFDARERHLQILLHVGSCHNKIAYNFRLCL